MVDVERSDVGPQWHDLVDAVDQVVVDERAGSRGQVVELVRRTRADDRAE